MEGTIGEIRLFAGNFAPRNWASCEGQILAISQNTALFSILGTTYGGNSVNTFALPDLRGRMPVGQGQGPGLSPIIEGKVGGASTFTLTVNNMPSHTHALSINNTNAGMVANAGGAYPNGKTESGESVVSSGPSLATASPSAIGPTGGNQPFPTMPPYLGLFYIICLYGVYPSRN